jgi:hypothetical protein
LSVCNLPPPRIFGLLAKPQQALSLFRKGI